MRVKSALLSFTVSLAVVVVGVGVIWLIAVPGVDRLWGLLAAAGVAYIVWAAGVLQRLR